MSIYSVATLGQPDNRITFNDYSGNPVFRAQSRAPQQFQVRSDNIPIPFESGVSDFNTLLGQTIYQIQGTMYPQDEASYDAGISALRAACSLDLEQSSIYNTDDGYVPYTWGEALSSKTLFVKALYVHLVENTRQGFVQPFTIYCKVKDPIIYGSVLKLASTAQSNPATTTGSAAYSFTYPVVYGSTLYTVSADANNGGNMPSYPFSITVYGPITNPTVTNTKTGEFITVNVTLSSGSDTLYIQYDKDTLIVTLNGVNSISKVTTASTYWKIKPGTNTIQLSGSSVGTGAYAVVGYRDSSPLA